MGPVFTIVNSELEVPHKSISFSLSTLSYKKDKVSVLQEAYHVDRMLLIWQTPYVSLRINRMLLQ
jgi:hypothetical protein